MRDRSEIKSAAERKCRTEKENYIYERNTSQKSPRKLEVFMDDIDLGSGEQSFVNKNYNRDLICPLALQSVFFLYIYPSFLLFTALSSWFSLHCLHFVYINNLTEYIMFPCIFFKCVAFSHNFSSASVNAFT